MDFSAIKELENKYAIKTAQRQNICFVRGEGNLLYDTNGRAYLDLVCGRGESCLGYGSNWLSAAIADQAGKLIALSDEYYQEPYGLVLEKLLKNTGYTKACLTKGASEASFAALKLSYNYLKEKGDQRHRVVIAAEGFHDEPQTDLNLKRVFVPFNNFAALKKALTPSTAILIIEPVISDGGVVFADYDYLVNAYALCKSMDIILYCDETHIGIGRTGTKLAFEHYGIQPDIVTLSRGLAGGMTLGAVLTRDHIAEHTRPGGRSLSSGGTALSCVAAGIVLDRLENEGLADIIEKGEYMLSRLYKLTKYNFVLDVRGRGLLAAVELSGRIMAAKIVSQMEKLGYLFSYTDGNVLRLSPPFTITRSEIDDAVNALSELFASTNV